ncbi:hypothetical protein JCM8547_003390 [Rhodosporidiobolus lusitaniae]
MATSTPTLPLELPPYTLLPLLAPVFPSSSSSRPTSPSKQLNPPSPTQSAASRFGALVGAAAAAAGSVTGVTVGAGAGAGPASVRCVEAGNNHVWLTASDGRVRTYEVHDHHDHAPVPTGLFSPVAPGSPSSSSGRRPPVKQHPVLELVDEATPTPTKKAADRIALLPRLDKAILLSEGVLTFHSLPSLSLLPASSFPAIKNVTTFSLDEDELAGHGSTGAAGEAMQLCVIKRKTIHWLRVTNEGLSIIKDLPLRGGAHVSILRSGRLCIADSENYSIVDLEAAEALPFLPISQAPHPDPLPPPSSALIPGGATPPPPPGGPDPRHRPQIAYVPDGEFLSVSHTGDTSIGVFVNDQGDPCRGTLQWASNVRSLVIDGPHSFALLLNSTIEIHSLSTLEIVQVVSLSSLPSFQPRSLARAPLSLGGLELGAATGRNKLEVVEVSLIPSSRPEPPSTPPPASRRPRASSSFSSSFSLRSSASPTTTTSPGPPAETRIVVAGKNGLYGLTPLTLVVQADALIEKGREMDAKRLAEEFEASEGASGRSEVNPELTYIYLRLAFLSLSRLAFQEAFDLFLRARADPRLVMRMFPDLRDPLMTEGSGERVEVLKGVREEVGRGRTVDEYILDNLNHNYSPHLLPSVESAAPTMELRASLTMTARDCLLSYLLKWRARRRDEPLHIEGEGEGGDLIDFRVAGVGDSRKVDMVVDTTLVRLLAAASRPADIAVLLSSAHDVVLPACSSSLLSAGLFELLSQLYLVRGEVRKTLEVWKAVVDGELGEGMEGEEVKGLRGERGVRRVWELVWKTREKGLTEEYGLWMLRHDSGLALKLFTDPKQTLTFDTRDLFAKMSKIDPLAADLYLESTVLQERDTDSRLHADLVKRYIGRLGEMLSEPEAKAHIREQESDYAVLSSSTSTPPSYLSFLTSCYSPSSPHSLLDRVRLKALLFLGGSSKYDVQGAKKELEEMEVRGLRGLTLERVVVYGKLKLDRQALSLLLHTLSDLSSAETYSLQGGDPLCASDITAAASKLELPFTAAKKSQRSSSMSVAKMEEEERRKKGLARLLVEMCLSPRQAGAEGEEGKLVASGEQVARLLETQAVHLDTLAILPLLPPSSSLPLLTPYLTRSLRRSLHSAHEASILKSLASAQNLAISERLFEMQEMRGGVVQLTPLDEGGEGEKEERREKKLVVVGGGGRAEAGGGEKPVGALGGVDDAVELDLR